MDSRELWMKAYDLAQERPDDWWEEFEIDRSMSPLKGVVLRRLLDGTARMKPSKYQPVPGLDVWLDDDRWKEGEIKEGDGYWVVNCMNPHVPIVYYYFDESIYRDCVSRGLAHKTKEGAMARAKVCGLLP